jgi:4-carboxymuconolactone decarboxylase
MASQDKVAEAHQTLWDEGIKIRTQVVGAEHVNNSIQNVSDFAKPMQELATEVGWGWVWARDGLDKKTRSLLNIAMLCALGRSHELGVHVRGAFNNGATEVEVREVILQAAIYSGFPAGLEGTRVAERVLKSWKEEQESKKT